MKNMIINNVMLNIEKSNDYSKEKLSIIKYGLEALYLTLTKLIVITMLCIILGLIKELLLFAVAFSIIKLTGFGLHAQKSWQCWVTSIPIFTIIPYLIKNAIIPSTVIYVILPITFISICLFAPADTEKRPLINKKKRVIYKVISILTSIVYSILILLVDNSYMISILTYALILQSIIINPLSYKLFGVKYNNYKNYKRKEDTK